MNAYPFRALTALSCVFAASILIGCGGGTDLSAIDSTLTAAGSVSPSTPDPTAYAHHAATKTGHHTICASSLAVYNDGQKGTLHYQADFYIDHFADGANHVWGNAYDDGRDGDGKGYVRVWVYNGWFC